VDAGAVISAGSRNAINYTGVAGKLDVTNNGNIEGSITLNSSSAITNSAEIYSPASIVGNLTNDSTLSLDSAAPALTITGNLTQNSSGVTLLDVWGGTAGLFNTINVTGTAHWDGDLTVNFQGYIPANGATFQILTADSATYTFHTIMVTGLYDGAQWQRLGTGDAFVLQIVTVPEPPACAIGIAGLLGGILLVRRRGVLRK